MKKMSPVVHFEMPARDHKRVSKFYEEAFGWKMNKWGDEKQEYTLATTSETGKDGFPKEPGRINGGFFTRDDSNAGFSMPSLVIAVEDIKKGKESVLKAGGKILTDITPVEGIGQYVSFEDTEGNRVGMLEPSKM